MASHGQLSGLASGKDTKPLSFLSRNIRDFVEITRLYHAAPIFLIYFPHLYGILYASIRLKAAYHTVLQQCCVLLLGSVFFSNAAHIWNDIIDKPLDAQNPRTRTRPIPRGAVSIPRALLFCTTQALLAASCFSLFPHAYSAIYAIPNIVATAYYPFSKRHSNYPQFVLGFCIAYGVVVGALSMGIVPVTAWRGGLSVDPELLCLFLAIFFWTVIFDTVYAHLDVHSDVLVGVGSTAVRFRHCAKRFLATQLFCMICALVVSGVGGNYGAAYYLFVVGGSLLSLGLLLLRVDLENLGSCWWWFGTGFWYTAGVVFIGLLMEYVLAQ
jgi:4-hydroxybenzoate polyprenyltransferase